MEWMQRLNQSIEYMEEHITEELDYEKVAQVANCPSYYFQQMFLYMTNMTLREYIRRRRLSLAAVELQKDSGKVIDIAIKYRYESPTAFTRAFKSFHGVVPSALKTENRPMQAFPPIQFHVSMDGGQPLKFRVEEKAAFRVVGISCPLNAELTQNFERIPTIWDTVLSDGTLAKLSALQERKPQGLLGISIHHTESWKYMIAVRSDRQADVFEEYLIPACKWAIFEGQGTNHSLQELEKRVITEWLPTSGYTYANSPDIEVYNKADPKNTVYEYWIPIV